MFLFPHRDISPILIISMIIELNDMNQTCKAVYSIMYYILPRWNKTKPKSNGPPCRPLGLYCPPSAPASGMWSTVPCATGPCPCSSSSPWWMARSSWAPRATTRSSTTFPAIFKVRLSPCIVICCLFSDQRLTDGVCHLCTADIWYLLFKVEGVYFSSLLSQRQSTVVNARRVPQTPATICFPISMKTVSPKWGL